MYSYDVFPLGVLSINQIEKGQQALNNMQILLIKNNEAELQHISNEFFTMIPHIS